MDIEEALQQGSVSLLSFALLRSHCCWCDHSLHEATLQSHIKAVELILKHDASNIDHHCRGFRPLHLAIAACMVDGDAGYQIAKLLLEFNSNPNYVDGDDVSLSSPLHNAVRRGCTGLVSMLLQSGARPNFQGADLSTALHIACKQATLFKEVMHNTHFVSVGLLLCSQADPNIIDDKGHVPGCYVQDCKLTKLLFRAQRHWRYKTLILVAHSFNLVGTNARTDIWLVPENLVLIASFL